MPRTILAIAQILAAAAVGGCARYEHLLVEPAESAQLISNEVFSVVREPLEYHMRQYDKRLQIRVENMSDEPVTLVGERSYIVDPEGESRPMRGATIAPDSYIDFMLPPVVRIYDAGPRFGVGIGVGTRFSHGSLGWQYHPYDWPYDRGGYSSLAPWRWKTGLVRVRLFYEHGAEDIEHQFVFERRRAE